MNWAALGILWVVLAFLAFFVWELVRESGDKPPDILTERLRAKVILTLKTGEAFRGVLWTQDARAVVLRNADALAMGERGTDIGVDGELVVLREDVAYLQVL